MTQMTDECLVFLKEAKESLEELKLLDAQESGLIQKESQLEKNLAAAKKRMADAVAQTVKKRREDIYADYDRESGRIQEQLKKMRSRREKAKNQGIKERIADETSGLHSEIRDLRVQMKTLMKKQHLPVYCRSQLYYSLYFPHRAKEYLTFLLFVLAAFLAVPGGIYLLIPERKLWQLFVIYLLDLVVFGGIYIAVGNRTKLLYMETLRQGRAILDEIQDNQRQIRRVTAAIRRDRNDAIYDLERFDDEISRLQQELDELSAQKKNAINTFESVTKNIITDEIEHNHQGNIDQLDREHAQAEMELKVVRQQIKEKRLYAADHYGVHLGREFMDPVKIGKLCLIVQNGQAGNVSEAIEVYQKNAET